jgi:hypothetical protein
MMWTDHVVSTRDYIIAAIGDRPDAQGAANRLMKNQEDIGNAVGQIYGAPAGQQLTTLLKERRTRIVKIYATGSPNPVRLASCGLTQPSPSAQLLLRLGLPGTF